jgi:hypothetical protein
MWDFTLCKVRHGLITITRTGNLGRIVRAGWMLRLRRTTFRPFDPLSLDPRRSAWMISPLLPVSEPAPRSTPSNVERACRLNKALQ